MKISSLFAWFIPELRKKSGDQLLKIWSACSPYSRNMIYLHLVLLLACSSAIFNGVMAGGQTKIVFGGLTDEDADIMAREVMRTSHQRSW